MKRIILIASFLTLSCSASWAASLDVESFSGKIEQLSDTNRDLELQIEWYCQKGDFFSTTGWQDCGEKYRGSKTVEIKSDGNFQFPRLDVSGPLFRGVFIIDVAISNNKNFTQQINQYGGKDYFQNHTPLAKLSKELRNLTLVKIKQTTISSSIIATEKGEEDIDFFKIKDKYPNSYNMSFSTKLQLTYDKTAGEPRTRAYHPTFSKQLEGTYEDGKIVYPESLWFIKGHKEGTNIEVASNLEAAIGLVKNTSEDSYDYKEAEVRDVITTTSKDRIRIPLKVLNKFKRVEINLD